MEFTTIVGLLRPSALAHLRAEVEEELGIAGDGGHLAAVTVLEWTLKVLDGELKSQGFDHRGQSLVFTGEAALQSSSEVPVGTTVEELRRLYAAGGVAPEDAERMLNAVLEGDDAK